MSPLPYYVFKQKYDFTVNALKQEIKQRKYFSVKTNLMSKGVPTLLGVGVREWGNVPSLAI